MQCRLVTPNENIVSAADSSAWQALRKNRQNILKMFCIVLFSHFCGNIPYNEARHAFSIMSLAERQHKL